MEDANGYNMIYAPMMLVWPEITGTQRRDLYVPDVVELLENFKYYVRAHPESVRLGPHMALSRWIAPHCLHALTGADRPRRPDVSVQLRPQRALLLHSLGGDI